MIEEEAKYDVLDYFSAAKDSDSIVSIRIKKGDGEWMNKSELAKVFKAMTEDRTDLGEAAAPKCFIG